jgi:hypothetical protein
LLVAALNPASTHFNNRKEEHEHINNRKEEDEYINNRKEGEAKKQRIHG